MDGVYLPDPLVRVAGLGTGLVTGKVLDVFVLLSTGRLLAKRGLPPPLTLVQIGEEVWGEGDTGLAAWVASRGDLLRRLLEGPHAVREEEAKEVLERTGELFRALGIRDGYLWELLVRTRRKTKEEPFYEPSPIDEGRSEGWGFDLQRALRFALYYTPMGFGVDPLVVQALRRVLRGG